MASSPGKRIRARWDMGIDGWKVDDDHEASGGGEGSSKQSGEGGKKEAALSLIFLRPSFSRDVTAADSLEGNWSSTTLVDC